MWFKFPFYTQELGAVSARLEARAVSNNLGFDRWNIKKGQINGRNGMHQKKRIFAGKRACIKIIYTKHVNK